MQKNNRKRYDFKYTILICMICISFLFQYMDQIENMKSYTCEIFYIDQNYKGIPKETVIQKENIIYDNKEINELYKIVEAEASGEDIQGKIMVANVILNRVKNKKFPDTIKDVIYAKGQFSPVSNGRIKKVSVSADTKEAVNRALSGEDYSHGALFFASRKYADSCNMRWFDNQLKKIAEHGGHEFFVY